MLFNPISNKLFTNDGNFIKEFHCPRGVKWASLQQSSSNQSTCEYCEKGIINTRNFSDDEIVNFVVQDEDVCLKLDFNDSNIRIINHNV